MVHVALGMKLMLSSILRMIASRVRTEVDSTARNSLELARSTTNLRTVAIIPSRSQVPINDFARTLHSALEAMGAPTAYLNQAAVSGHLGRHAFTRMGKLKAAGWLASQEQRYRMVLYVADSSVNSPWTQTCIKQVCQNPDSYRPWLTTRKADCVMIVGFGDDPTPGEYERLLLGMKTTARKELVLLHPDRSVLPGSTREWLKVGR
jgi:lysophospholipid hydrolase